MKFIKIYVAGCILAVSFVAFICQPQGFPEEHLSRLLSRPFPETLKEQFPGGWNEYLSTAQYTVFSVYTTLGAAFNIYIDFEGKLPGTIKEVCESPYMPFPCQEILNPYTKKPLLETPAGTAGHVEYKPPQDLKSLPPFLPLYLTVPDWEDNPLSVKERQTFITIGPYSPDYVYKGLLGLEPAWGTAAGMEHLIASSITAFTACTGGRGPQSFEELANMFPYLRKLRNGFTGGYANLIFERTIPTNASREEVEKQIKELKKFKGTPGDFAIVWNGLPSRVVVYGLDGRGIGETFDERTLTYRDTHLRTSIRKSDHPLP